MCKPIPELPPHCYTTTDDDAKRRFWRMIFRFLNITEPGPEVVLSPTRVGMWIIVFLLPYTAVFNPTHLIVVLGAILPFLLNYMHQRRVDAQTGKNPNAFRAPPAAETSQDEVSGITPVAQP